MQYRFTTSFIVLPIVPPIVSFIFANIVASSIVWYTLTSKKIVINKYHGYLIQCRYLLYYYLLPTGTYPLSSQKAILKELNSFVVHIPSLGYTKILIISFVSLVSCDINTLWGIRFRQRNSTKIITSEQTSSDFVLF